ncbi:MAG: N-acetylmuramoyl-L-alanine amidase [Microgenomates group bacterium]
MAVWHGQTITRPITGIIIHCTATRPVWMASRPLSTQISEVRRWHMRDRGFADIGYHRLIGRKGERGDGRPMNKVGAHTIMHNVGTIGVSLIGGFDSAATDTFLENFTDDQESSLVMEIHELWGAFGKVPVSGHNDWAPKACPGFKVAAWMKTVGL